MKDMSSSTLSPAEIAARRQRRQEALQSLQRFTTMFRGIGEVAADLAEITSIEGATLEANAALKKVRDEIDLVKSEQDDRAKAVVSEARIEADKILSDARDEAAKLIAAAHDTAAEAENRTAATHAEHTRIVDASAAKQVELAARTKDHEELVTAIGEKESHLKNLNETIARLRSQFVA
jgi:cell division septum initiation protein DivIVA